MDELEYMNYWKEKKYIERLEEHIQRMGRRLEEKDQDIKILKARNEKFRLALDGIFRWSKNFSDVLQRAKTALEI